MQPLSPDLSLLSDGKGPSQPVGITRYGKDGQSLSFINASHYDDTADTSNPTARTIATAINLMSPPKALIIEGTDGLHPPKGEPEYAASLARKKGIPVIGGEPTDAEVFKKMEAKGYSTKDTMGMYMLRIMERDKYPDEAAMDKGVTKYFETHKAFSHVPQDQRMTAEEFKSWYKEHDHTGKPPHSIKTDDIAPKPDGAYFQQMMAESGAIRDRHIAQVAADAVNKYGDVAMVYGDGHQKTLAPVFEQMLGKGKTTIVVPPPTQNLSVGWSCDDTPISCVLDSPRTGRQR